MKMEPLQAFMRHLIIEFPQNIKGETISYTFVTGRKLWRENDKEIRPELDGLSKVKDLKMPTTKRELLKRNEPNKCTTMVKILI